MSKFHFLWRSIRYYWKFLLLTILGIITGTAVITGSLIVGTSVPKSLETIATQRMGKIDFALSHPKLFTVQLADKLRKENQDAIVASSLSLEGMVKNQNTQLVIPEVNILGIDSHFYNLYSSELALKKREIAINSALAADLKVKEEEWVLLYVYRESLSPNNTLFARKKREDNVFSLRAKISKILPDEGMGSFRLDANPQIPRNVFVAQNWLSETIDKENKINTILVSGKEAPALTGKLSFADLGWYIKTNGQQLFMQSKNFVFASDAVSTIENVAKNFQIDTYKSSIYLVDTMQNTKNSENVAYAIVTGNDRLDVPSNEIFINTWLQQDLQVQLDDELKIEYLVSNEFGILAPTEQTFTVKQFLEMDNQNVSMDFVPEFAGMTDADSIQDWNVPFDVDLSLVSARDEEYWEKYKAAPKAFVSMATMQKIWEENQKSQDSWVSTIVMNTEHSALKVENIVDKITALIKPESHGFIFRPVRQMAIIASKGSTDFSGLFIAMNFFVLMAAIALVVMLTKLYTTNRASQIGIMCAQGFSYKEALSPIFKEGILYSFGGSVIGVFIGCLYAKAIIYLLTTKWVGAVGTTALTLHIENKDIIMGIAIGFLIGVFAIYLGMKNIKKFSILRLLSGWRSLLHSPQKKVRSPKYFYTFLLAAIALLVCGQLQIIAATVSFFGGGAFFLASCYCGLSFLLTLNNHKNNTITYLSFLHKNISLYRERYILIFMLFTFASFILIAVAANQSDFSRIDPLQKDSGTGGFNLQAKVSFPLHYDLGSAAGREKLGFTKEDEAYFSQSEIFPLWFYKGEDISCLNLAKVATPNIIGASHAFINRGGFSLTPYKNTQNPWELLDDKRDNIPAIADANSVMWSLHSGLGKDLEMDIPKGTLNVHFVGLLHNSILASEIVVSEQNFRKLFPHIASPTYYLISCPNNIRDEIQTRLQKNLGDMGIVIKNTPEILNSFIQVQNTYLMTFLTLGALGIFLGVFGLTIVIVYSVMQRQNEFALLKCLGMLPRSISRIIFREISLILLLGLVCGTSAALISIHPQIVSSKTDIHWQNIISILGGILVFSVVVTYVTTKFALKMNLLESLRKE